MARVAWPMPGVPSVRDIASWSAASVFFLRPSGITCNFGFRRTRSSGISNVSPIARPTRRRGKMPFAARANEVPPKGSLTGNDTTDQDFETCEIVQGAEVTLGKGQGSFQGYLVQAIKNNSGVAVLFLTDILGFNDGDNRDFAYRLACFGYNVLVPDLFRGVPWSKERAKDDYEKWRELHSPDRVAEDIDVATKYLLDHFGSTGKLGAIGFCFGGGRLIETLAKDSNNHFETGAFLYGTRFESSLATQIKVPLLLIAGDSDDLCSPTKVRHLEQTVQGSKAKIYPGFGHAFAHHPSGPEEDEAAEDAFTEIRHWFRDHLRSDILD